MTAMVFHRLWSVPGAAFSAWTEPDRDAGSRVEESETSIEQIAYAQGLADGQTQRHQMDSDALDRLVNAIDALCFPQQQRLSALIGDAVHAMLADLIGTASVDAVLLRQRCEAAAAMVGTQNSVVMLALHPDDRALIDQTTTLQHVQWVDDATMVRGECRMLCGDVRIDDGPWTRLNAAMSHDD